MYDSGKIIAGLVIFAGLLTLPFLMNLGKAAPPPKPKIITKAKACVEDTHYMRTTHMQLLNEWRDWALRDGHRLYVNEKGEKIGISLQRTCMKCHSNKKDFCDQCHNYADVRPYCWDCHFIPEGRKTWASTEGHF